MPPRPPSHKLSVCRLPCRLFRYGGLSPISPPTSPLARALLVLLLAPLLGAPAERLPTPDPLRAAGWQKGGWSGLKPATFEALPDTGLRITGVGQASFVWRTVTKADACLYWRWRVDQGPPPWTCPYQTVHLAWLGDLLAMNSRGDLMRKPECGWMLL